MLTHLPAARFVLNNGVGFSSAIPYFLHCENKTRYSLPFTGSQWTANLSGSHYKAYVFSLRSALEALSPEIINNECKVCICSPYVPFYLLLFSWSNDWGSTVYNWLRRKNQIGRIFFLFSRSTHIEVMVLLRSRNVNGPAVCVQPGRPTVPSATSK